MSVITIKYTIGIVINPIYLTEDSPFAPALT